MTDVSFSNHGSPFQCEDVAKERVSVSFVRSMSGSLEL